MSAQEVARLVLRRLRDYPAAYHRGAWVMDSEGLAIQEAASQERALSKPLEDWKQAGLKACVAGHVVAVGLELYPGWKPGTKQTWSLTTSGEKVESWDFPAAGKELLGLTRKAARWLFTPERPKKQVERKLRQVANGICAECESVRCRHQPAGVRA